MDKILKENLTSLDFRDVMSRPVEMCCFAESVNTLIQNQLFDLIYSYITKTGFFLLSVKISLLKPIKL